MTTFKTRILKEEFGLYKIPEPTVQSADTHPLHPEARLQKSVSQGREKEDGGKA